MAHFFGFGSLVNTATHQYSEVHPARVNGFARAWINNDCYEHAFLSVIREPQTNIQGLLARVWNDDWHELDKREVGYARQSLAPEAWSLENELTQGQLDNFIDVQLYQHAYGDFAQSDKPILWSYLETVLFGYYQVFGVTGVHSFIDSTRHWTIILDDRSNALYPRYVPATGEANSIVLSAIEKLALKKT
ncbi:MAG: hypothetical protein ACI9J2_001754 [Saprospiraceae bacterium]|jgi:hypothetical protein